MLIIVMMFFLVVRFPLFEDDSAIWCTIPELEHGIQWLQIALHKIAQWSKENGLELFVEKSTVMIFSKKKTRTVTLVLPKLNKDIINQVSHLEVLRDRLRPSIKCESACEWKHRQANYQTRLNSSVV